MKKFLILVGFIWVLSIGYAEAANLYASPSGSGSTCTDVKSPCSSDTIRNAGQPGDTLYYAAGTYATSWHSVRAGTAANPIKIRPTVVGTYPKFQPTSTPTNGRNLWIRHSYIDMAGLHFDCTTDTICSDNNGRIIGSGTYPSETFLQGVKVRDVKFTGMNPHVFVASTSGLLISYTYSEETIDGGQHMEPWYLGGSSGNTSNNGLVIYGATIYRVQGECVDFKLRTIGADAHHIWCENSGWWTNPVGLGLVSGTPNTGVVGFSGTSNVARRWIIKGHRVNNSYGCATFYNNMTAQNSRLEDSVCRDSIAGGVLSGAASGHSGIVQRNTFCNLVSYGQTNTQNITKTDNVGLNSPGADSSACDAVEAAIIAEIAARPVIVSAVVENATPNKMRVTLNNASMATTDGAAIYGNSSLIHSVNISGCTISGSPSITISSAEVVVGSSNIIDYTLSGSFANGQVRTFSCPAGAIVSTGNIGGPWISNLASTATITNQSITNNVGGSAPTYVLDIVDYKLYSLIKDSNGVLVPFLGTYIQRGAPYVIVLQLNNTVANAPVFAAKLRFSLNGGSIIPLPNVPEDEKLSFFGNSISLPGIPIDGETLTGCLSGALTPVDGSIQRTANAIPNVTLTQDQCRLFGFIFKVEYDAALEAIVRFYLYNQDGTPLNALPSAIPTYSITHPRARF